jgi:drug/metabolite transporter (DMT)-like permease
MAVALIALIFLRGRLSPRRAYLNGRLLAFASLLYFTFPAVLLERSKEYASDVTVTIVFAIAPVVVLLTWGAVSREGLRPSRLMFPLAGLAGILLLLPYELPESARGWESLAEVFAAMMLVAYASTRMNELLRKPAFPESLVLIGAVNALALFGFSFTRRTATWHLNAWNEGALIGTATDAVSIVLTVWLLRKMNPVRFSARFLAIPLVTIIEGLVLVRPEFSARLLAGMILLTVAAAWLLITGQTVEDEILTLR